MSLNVTDSPCIRLCPLESKGIPAFGYAILMGSVGVMLLVCLFGFFGRDGLRWIQLKFGRPRLMTRRQEIIHFKRDLLDSLKYVPYAQHIAETTAGTNERNSSASEDRERCRFCFIRFQKDDSCAVIHQGCGHFFHQSCELREETA